MSQSSNLGGILSRIWWGVNLTRQILLNFLFFGLLLIVLLMLVSSDRPEVPRGAALVVNPSGMLVDQETGTPFEQAMDRMFGQERPETLVRDVTESIRMARDDDRIDALVLQLRDLHGGGLSKLQDIADAIEDFRESEKPVYAIGDGFSQSQYYLAAQADEVFMHPSGQILISGFDTYRNYYKQAIDLLDAEWNVFRVGEYKSFVEPYTRDDMSPEDREARLAYLTDLWENWKADTGDRRGIDSDTIQAYVDEMPNLLDEAGGDTAAMAYEAGLVDALIPRDEMRERLIEVVGEDDNHGYKHIGMSNYLEARKDKRKRRRGDEIGVVLAVGQIMDGSQSPGTIGGDSTARLIREAREDSDLAALVLRVDSPGGSAFASDVILREIEITQEKGIPVVVSMGSTAASGGYWISMSADEIWAHPTTVTGSIGILSMFPTFEGTLDKIGISTDGVGTTELAGAFRVDRHMNEGLRRMMESGIQHGYDDFIEKVAHHRDMSVSEVDDVARGRVWSGTDAHRAGLVDELGDLNDALESAAAMAEIEDWQPRFIEHRPGFWESFLGDAAMSLARIVGPDVIEQRLHQNPQRQLLEQLKEDFRQMESFNDPNHEYYFCDTCVIR